jgi:hypothetical protein
MVGYCLHSLVYSLTGQFYMDQEKSSDACKSLTVCMAIKMA